MNSPDLIKLFGAFFAIMNPFVNLPIFLALTSDLTVEQQRAIAIKATLCSALMCAVILLAGQKIIAFFGITIDQFRIAGGLVLAHIAWSMLNGQSFASHQGSSSEKDDLSAASARAFYPLAFPMIVGPGTIATIILAAGHAPTLEAIAGTATVIGLILALLFATLYFAAAFGKVLSETMRVVTTRLMGMILLSISVEMVVTGLVVVLPGLAARG